MVVGRVSQQSCWSIGKGCKGCGECSNPDVDKVGSDLQAAESQLVVCIGSGQGGQGGRDQREEYPVAKR